MSDRPAEFVPADAEEAGDVMHPPFEFSRCNIERSHDPHTFEVAGEPHYCLHARSPLGQRTPFMIGSDVWPGIAKLAEECGEVVQVVGKIIALTGDENYTHWDGSDVRERLMEEMADVTAAIQFVWAHNLLGDRQTFEDRVEEKFMRFQGWHSQQKRAHNATAPTNDEGPHIVSEDAQ